MTSSDGAPREILKKPESGVDAETKQALLKAGLLSDSENDLSSQKKEKPVSTEIGEHSQGVPSPITGTQNMQNSKFNEQQSQPAGRRHKIDGGLR